MMEKDYFAHETAVIDDGCIIGKDCKIWHFSHIMKDAVIGEKCNIGQNVVVSPGVILGNNVKVQNNVSIYTGVICEDDVFLGPSMVFTNIINPRSAVIRHDQYARTIVRKGASIGANATVICGHEIGEFSFIGARLMKGFSRWFILTAFALVATGLSAQTEPGSAVTLGAFLDSTAVPLNRTVTLTVRLSWEGSLDSVLAELSSFLVARRARGHAVSSSSRSLATPACGPIPWLTAPTALPVPCSPWQKARRLPIPSRYA